MRKVPFSKARAELTDIVNLASYAGERCMLTKNGKNIAGIVSADDLEILEMLEDEKDLQAAKKALARIRKEGTISHEQVKRDLKRNVQDRIR